jgi:predicted DNA-binding transcriptional regulator AlpA
MATRPNIAATYAPEGLSRCEAARYVGLGETTFDDAVKQGLMPRPRRYPNARRVVWLKRELDRALEDLPIDGDDEAGGYAGIKL